MNRNIIRQITILANRNHIHEMELWRIGIGIYLSPKYQRIDLQRIYSQTIHELFANRELFAEHCHVSHVTCHMSPVNCHMSFLFFFFITQKKGLSTRVYNNMLSDI